MLPLAKAPARRAPPTPEEVAKIVTDKRPSPVGQPTKVEIFLRLVLPRPVLEQLSVRAIREGRNIEGLIPGDPRGCGQVTHVAIPSQHMCL